MNNVQMAAKLYECRDTAKRFFEDEYKTKLKPYTDIIKSVMLDNKLDELQAFLKISKTETYQENPMGQMMFMAALVELIEPSN